MPEEVSETIRQLKVDIDTDTADLEDAIEKAERLKEKIDACTQAARRLDYAFQSIADSISSMLEMFQPSTEGS